ncbi:MAG: 4-oxalocrotonate tautomerase family protein [Symploca sp. SIO3C6]|uniref:Tautomerase n=1 Tax=Symploca sp. SIO1C4 TaxID=2607765 RepID=A0A6B3NFX9_9CYAN|nr:4-oxalocrotonate tautomerase family protein [Symploca sp. SIO3C6]NER28894.1 4-oxalocrotonate tautomerase family protein [Symploca sp. SIO1C4]NET06507.1 4-oxalocrotonate tautomerase family protein [Symploca sp. SIO2B6]
MPFVTVQIAQGHSVELKRKLVQSLTDTLVSTLGTKPEWVTIHIDEFDRENWAVGGQLHSDKHHGRQTEKSVN